MIRTTLQTTIRMTGDVLQRRDGKQQILPSIALRIADHHLHASGIIPHTTNDSNNDSRLYKHDWFCVSQAVDCYPVERLVQKSMNDAHSSLFVMKVGSSSIHFGNTLTMKDELLATTRRVFCRKDTSSDVLDPFTEEERDRFLEFEPPKDIKMPQLERFDTSLSSEITSTNPILSVKVGPAHINFGNHADHAFMAEVANHALSLGGNEKDKECTGLTINYISETHLGDTLDCYYFHDKVYVTRMTANNNEEEDSMLVLIAK